jgi:peptidylprolyl isomerase
MIMRTRFFAGMATLLLLVGCTTDGGSTSPLGSDQKSISGSGREEGGKQVIDVQGEAGQAPELGAPVGAPPSSLITEDIFVGNGVEAQPDSQLTVHYTLMAWSTGEVVESSWSGGAPATFGLNQVIQGWQEGIPGMREGGRRLLVIPPQLGYGAAGGGPIAPNETLIFVVDLIKVG